MSSYAFLCISPFKIFLASMNEFLMEMNTPTPPGDRKFLYILDYNYFWYKINVNN